MRMHVLGLAAVAAVALSGIAWAGEETPGAGPGEDRGERFKKMDANGNGVIDRDEFRGPTEVFDKIDADGSGTLTKEEMKAAHEKRAQERFKKMDANGNGVIDRDEFRGPPEAFDKIDADKSGGLSPEELKNASPMGPGGPHHGDGPGEGDGHRGQRPPPPEGDNN
jgi:Ca2+-binding EF-hand superfamily protein